ncbi:MAG: hypothetical protein ACI4OC_02290 [Coriobacteriales bacterium]|nr:hypothetical protein [Coriobacteriales bacterium]MDD6738801.1 hypothetical protein [Coriobacteriaceae bacterium]MDD6768513.1 hypothetical protein [Coriobacteriaceae bacterium]
MGRPRYLAESGQASLEYAAVTAALLVVAMGLGALWHFGSEGGFGLIARAHASHALASQGGVIDVLLY